MWSNTPCRKSIHFWLFVMVPINSDLTLQWWTLRNRYFEAIYLQNHIAEMDPNYFLVFTVYLGITRIFRDTPTGNKQKSQKWQKHMLFVYLLWGNRIRIDTLSSRLQQSPEAAGETQIKHTTNRYYSGISKKKHWKNFPKLLCLLHIKVGKTDFLQIDLNIRISVEE